MARTRKQTLASDQVVEEAVEEAVSPDPTPAEPATPATSGVVEETVLVDGTELVFRIQ